MDSPVTFLITGHHIPYEPADRILVVLDSGRDPLDLNRLSHRK